MSYASPIKPLPETLRSSTGLAILASLGIHGLLWVVLPVLPLDSESIEADPQRTVGLVELTPAEQSRLPQGSTPPVNLPSFATQPSALPPLPPPPPSFNLLSPSGTPVSQYPSIASLPSVLPPLPPPPPSLNLLPPSGTPISKYPLTTSLPQSQTLRVPLAAQNNQSFTSAFPFGKLPEPAPRQTAPLRQFSPPSLFTPPANSSLPYLRLQPAEGFSPPDTLPNSTAQENTNLQVARSRLENRPAAPFQLENPSERGREERLAALQQRLRQQSAQQVARTTSPEAKPATSARPENPSERGKEERLAALQQRLQQSAQQAARTNPEAKSPPASAQPENTPGGREERLVALQQRLQQSARQVARTNPEAKPPAPAQPENTPGGREERLAVLQQRLQQQSDRNPASYTSVATAERLAQIRAWSERQNRVQKNNSNVETKAPIYKTIKTCKREIEGVAVLGVVVNPEGKIVSGPDLLDKKGAAGIEQAAKNYVKEYGFSRSDNPTNQQFRLQYDYDTAKCAEANQNPASENTNTDKPKPAPENKNTEQPKS